MFLHTLTTEVRRLLAHLSQEPLVRPFYLAGGSAAALHLGHRVSVDLDFFTPQDSYEAEPLVQALQRIGHLDIEQQSRGTLNGRLAGVRISFFIYPYPLLEEMTDLDGMQVARLTDIALMKITAIGQRGALRDFIDLYFICRGGYALDDLLRRVPEKYPTVSYPSYHLLRALAYFEDAEGDEPPRMLVPFDWTETKRFFEEEVRRLMKRL
ncbi:MAG: nucleotidyl transferase AbiEii/AbiGii toxin family protein [Anaerolineae bacterium]